MRTDGSDSCALVHCLAGVSRSATVAIAYVMQHLSLSSEEGLRFVKERRPSVAPNFNFLGQLLEWEKEVGSGRGADEQMGTKKEERGEGGQVRDGS